MKALILFFIRSYKRFISPLCPPACRFVPTCSEYAIEAFEKKDTLTALRLTVARLLKCHPFHPGGYDPVEPPRQEPEAPYDIATSRSSRFPRK